MSKRISAIVFAAILIFALSVPAMAAPYNGGTTISGEKTIVHATNFDTEDFLEFSAEKAEAEGHSWFWEAREEGSNYYIRTEYQENMDGPQTESIMEDDVSRLPELPEVQGGISYSSGPWGDYDAEWVQYSLNVEAAGTYKFDVWATSGAGQPITIFMNGEAVGLVDVPNTGWGSAYALFEVGQAHMARGVNILKLEFTGGDVNVGAFEVTLLEADPVEVEEEAADGGDAAAPADGGDTPAPAANNNASDDDDGGMILWIIIAIAAVVVIVVIVILVTRKKK